MHGKLFRSIDRSFPHLGPNKAIIWLCANARFPPRSSSMKGMIGQSLGRYKITSLLGEGGMGAVFRAEDATLQRDVAIKVMHQQFASQPNFQERFLQEARTAAKMDHPGIVQVFDFGQQGNLLFIVMEFVPGENLRQLLKFLKKSGKWIGLEEAVQLVRHVCLAIHYAHQEGVLHRDIKPANIMLKSKPSEDLPFQPVMTDLGLAKLLEGGIVTQTGVTMGTPGYMSPEQALGTKTDARSDVYSLGILLYELAAGQLPHPISTLSDAIRFHNQDPLPAPTSFPTTVPEEIQAIILQALKKNPDDRFAHAKELARELANAIPVVKTVALQPAALESIVSLATPYQQSLVGPRSPTFTPDFPKTPSDISRDRIQIIAKDQTIRTIDIKGKTLSIGRGPENDIVIDDRMASRHHAKVEFDGNNYRIVDLNSTNGTYLNDMKILPNVPEEWSPDWTVRIGDSFLRVQRSQVSYRPETPPPGPTFFEPSQVQTSIGEGRVGVFMENTKLFVEPGGSTTGTLILLNQSRVVDHFKVAVEGIPGEWVPPPLPVVYLMPSGQEEVSVNFSPPREPSSQAGIHPIKFRVASQDAPDQVVLLDATLDIGAFYHLDLNIRPQKARGLKEGTFTLEFRNLGNADLTLQPNAEDPEAGCQYLFAPPDINLPAGQDRLTHLKVKPIKVVEGLASRSFPFIVTVRTEEKADLIRQVQGEWIQVLPSFEMSLQPQTSQDLREGIYSVQLKNRSEVDFTIQLEAQDAAQGCTFSFEASNVHISAGEERLVRLNVLPNSPNPGPQSTNFPFTIIGQVLEVPTISRQAQGIWEHLPTPVAPPEPTKVAEIPVPVEKVPVPEKIPIPPHPEPIPAKKSGGSRGCIVLVVGLIITAIAGYAAGFISFEIFGIGDPGAWVVAGFVWLVGLYLTIKSARN
jgi:serine/threonine protein kinase